MSSRWLLRSRALLAVTLFVGFYVLALAMAVGLLYLPYAELVYAKRLHLKLALFAVIGAGVILKAIIPRQDRFVPPGPSITAEEEPQLMALVEEVARATGQRPPADVYLVPDVNAFVAERGGTLGIGSRRVMGIGVPLLELLSVAELRAVIAHEFGHFIGGDTGLGSWIYKTRSALARTLAGVGGHSAALAKPFEWYGTAFLRVTHAISRAQEYVADETAARVAGVEPARRALIRLTAGDGAFAAFWRSEMAPVLEQGFRPPLAAGLRRFMTAPGVPQQMDALVERTLDRVATDPYDTHPSLRDRLAALGRLPSMPAALSGGAADDQPASTLLTDPDGVEARLLASVGPRRSLQAVSWDDVPHTVLAMAWEDLIRDHGRGLAGLQPDQLPDLLRDPRQLPVRLRLSGGVGTARREDWDKAASLVGAAVSLAVARRVKAGSPDVGLSAPPGEPVIASAGEWSMQPFAVCEALASGRLTAEAWLTWCQKAEIASVDLGRIPEPPGVPQVPVPVRADHTNRAAAALAALDADYEAARSRGMAGSAVHQAYERERRRLQAESGARMA